MQLPQVMPSRHTHALMNHKYYSRMAVSD